MGAPQPPDAASGAGADGAPQLDAAGGVATGGKLAGGVGVAAAAPHPPDTSDDAAGVGAVGGAAQLCDIGPVPDMAEPVGRASQLEEEAGGAAASLPPVQPRQSAGAGFAFRSAACCAAASSSEAAIS